MNDNKYLQEIRELVAQEPPKPVESNADGKDIASKYSTLYGIFGDQIDSFIAAAARKADSSTKLLTGRAWLFTPTDRYHDRGFTTIDTVWVRKHHMFRKEECRRYQFTNEFFLLFARIKEDFAEKGVCLSPPRLVFRRNPVQHPKYTFQKRSDMISMQLPNHRPFSYPRLFCEAEIEEEAEKCLIVSTDYGPHSYDLLKDYIGVEIPFSVQL